MSEEKGEDINSGLFLRISESKSFKGYGLAGISLNWRITLMNLPTWLEVEKCTVESLWVRLRWAARPFKTIGKTTGSIAGTHPSFPCYQSLCLLSQYTSFLRSLTRPTDWFEARLTGIIVGFISLPPSRMWVDSAQAPAPWTVSFTLNSLICHPTQRFLTRNTFVGTAFCRT